MDLISSRTIDLLSLGLDGLSARHKAIASNIANAEVAGYKRVDISFEGQLEKIIGTENIKETQRLANSTETPMPMQINYNRSLMGMEDFNPQTYESDENSPDETGNTVNIEKEMSVLTKTGMTYNALAVLEAKSLRGISDIIFKSQ